MDLDNGNNYSNMNFYFYKKYNMNIKYFLKNEK